MPDADAAFLAIADPTRRAILVALADGEVSATVFVDHFALSQPAISKHLKVLRDSGLVRVRSESRFRYYALEPSALEPVRDWMAHFEHFWINRLEALGAHLRKKKRSR